MINNDDSLATEEYEKITEEYNKAMGYIKK